MCPNNNMISKLTFILFLLSFFPGAFIPIAGIKFPYDTTFSNLHLKHRPVATQETESRIQNLHKRVIGEKDQNTISKTASPESYSDGFSGRFMASLKSGFTLGSEEYFIDVLVGNPPRRFSFILDTGSDFNWIQCVPCYDCYDQNGPHYDPNYSTSFRNINCHDSRCNLVSLPDSNKDCMAENQTCQYYYWYGDGSNTRGEFGLEMFRMNFTWTSKKSELKQVEDVMFGCGHWNQGKFHGAAGILGFGKGPLSFSTHLQSLYGHSFAYCLVDRYSDINVSSKLIFGDTLAHPKMNFTSFVDVKKNPYDTFYHVHIKSIIVGGQVLNIPKKTWDVSKDGSGGTIIDSGTTLSRFADPAYQIIKDAFVEKLKGYNLVKNVDGLELCYNVSGIEKIELPEFGIMFSDGAMWNFPVENYFIQYELEDVICLAIQGNGLPSDFSVIGNFQQQNFYVLYDTNESRLGYMPMNCADV